MKTTKFTPDQTIINADAKVIKMMPKGELQSVVTAAAEAAYGEVPTDVAEQIAAASKAKLCTLYGEIATLIKEAQDAPKKEVKLRIASLYRKIERAKAALTACNVAIS